MKKISKQMVNGRFCVDSIVRTSNERNSMKFIVEVNGKFHNFEIKRDEWGCMTFYDYTRGLYHITTDRFNELTNLTKCFDSIDCIEDLFEKGYGTKIV